MFDNHRFIQIPAYVHWEYEQEAYKSYLSKIFITTKTGGTVHKQKNGEDNK